MAQRFLTEEGQNQRKYFSAFWFEVVRTRFFLSIFIVVFVWLSSGASNLRAVDLFPKEEIMKVLSEC